MNKIAAVTQWTLSYRDSMNLVVDLLTDFSFQNASKQFKWLFEEFLDSTTKWLLSILTDSCGFIFLLELSMVNLVYSTIKTFLSKSNRRVTGLL